LKKVLVTGASGFIGNRLIKQLAEMEVSIRLISRQNQLNYETIICDLQSELVPQSALETIDTVFHLAGFAHDMRGGNEIDEIYRKINVDATVHLANLSKKAGVKSFIFVSSIKAGGRSNSQECNNENNQSEPEGIYGKTKREAEIALLNIAHDSDMHLSIIRSSLVYGPNLKGNLKVMKSGIEKGWFPPLPETGNKKSMIHVDDLIRAIMLVVKDSKTSGEIYIATDGKCYSSREIYNTICSLIGKPIPRWGVPKILFDLGRYTNKKIKYKINKLLDNDCYSSAKLQAIGFKAKKSLKDMNETDF
jgi:UDP-glucose 4-epimerase